MDQIKIGANLDQEKEDSQHSNQSQQFQFIQDVIPGAASGQTISKESLFREMASESLLKSIGVDIDKFMESKKENVSNNQGAGTGGAFANILGIQQEEAPSIEKPDPVDEDFEDENQDDANLDNLLGGLPNPLAMPSLSEFQKQDTKGLLPSQMNQLPHLIADNEGIGSHADPVNKDLPNPLQMPSLGEFKNPNNLQPPIDNKSTKQMQLKMRALDRSKEPITDEMKEQFTQNHIARMKRIDERLNDQTESEQRIKMADEPPVMMFTKIEKNKGEAQFTNEEMVLESMSSSSEDEDKRDQVKVQSGRHENDMRNQPLLNKQERIILVQVGEEEEGSEDQKLKGEQIKSKSKNEQQDKYQLMLEDQRLISNMVQCIQLEKEGEVEEPNLELQGQISGGQESEKEGNEESVKAPEKSSFQGHQVSKLVSNDEIEQQDKHQDKKQDKNQEKLDQDSSFDDIADEEAEELPAADVLELLDDGGSKQNEHKLYKIDKITYDLELQSKDSDYNEDEAASDKDKYRQYMSWMPKAQEEEAPEGQSSTTTKLSKGQKRKMKLKQQQIENNGCDQVVNIEASFQNDPFRIQSAKDREDQEHNQFVLAKIEEQMAASDDEGDKPSDGENGQKNEETKEWWEDLEDL